jgi:serine/threonine protein kinase
VKAAARLSHRNIVTAHDAEQIGSLHFLVMEFVEGESLYSLVAREGRLPVKRACYYIWQAAQGLGHAHESGMVHRDIKPQNLMLTPQGVVKILDFGLARLAAQEGMDDDKSGLTAVGIAVGTPDYMAPEQARDSRRVDARADIYSLGATFYFLLTGQTLFPEGTALERVLAQIERQPRPATELRSEIPHEVADILNRMLQKDPAKRYQTPGEVAEALKQFLKQPANPASPQSEVDEETPLMSLTTSVLPPPPRRSTRRSTSRGRKRRRAIRRLQRHIKWIAPLMLFCGWVLWWMLRDPESTPDGLQTGKNPIQSQDATNPGRSQGLMNPTQSEALGQWIDLMPTVRTEQAIQGQWLVVGGELHVKAQEGARLVLPYRVPAEYDFEIAFTRKSGRYSIAMIFPAGSGQATYEVDAWGMNLAGMQNIGSQTLQDRREPVPRIEITNGKRYVMLLKVRSHEVQAYLDGKPVAKYHGDGSDLSLLPVWDLRNSSALGLGAFDAMTTFHQIRIRPVSNSRG